MKIRPTGAELFHVDGRTDTTKLIGAFRIFGDAPKKGLGGGGGKDVARVGKLSKLFLTLKWV